jgi:hypothetical protein
MPWLDIKERHEQWLNKAKIEKIHKPYTITFGTIEDSRGVANAFKRL